MAKKKHGKKKSNAGISGRAQRHAEQTYTFRRGALGKGELWLLGAGSLLLLAAFILSILEVEFLQKQSLVFLLMGGGCAVIAYLQSKTIRTKRSGGRTALFWVVAALAVLYLAVGIYTLFVPVS